MKEFFQIGAMVIMLMGIISIIFFKDFNLAVFCFLLALCYFEVAKICK